MAYNYARGRFSANGRKSDKVTKKEKPQMRLFLFRGAYGSRTRDLQIANLTLYQLS